MSSAAPAIATGSEARAAIPISVATLFPESVPGVSLFIGAGTGSTYRLYRGAEHSVTAADLDNLRSRGISKLYVSGDEYAKYQSYLREHLDRVLADDSVSVERRLGCLNEVVRDVLGDLFRRKDLDNQIGQLKKLGETTVDAICRDAIVLGQLKGVLLHDYHTFMHSANVSFYSVMLAQSLGIRDRTELSAIATGGLLHDAGKLDIPASILSKPGMLTPGERHVIQRHPTLGFGKICHREDLSFGQLMMVYQHHEQVQGGGYPVGCALADLHVWGRICAVADVFEALTANRPYRAGLPFEKACEMMAERPGTLDADFLKCWIEFALAA